MGKPYLSEAVGAGGRPLSSSCEIWPNFFIVGAIKCGTTSLYEILKAHPQVFLPEIKEPHFFLTVPPVTEKAKARAWNSCIGQPDVYRDLYRAAGAYRAIGDASPTYLWDEGSPRKISEVSPDARIIVLLRDPVIRAYSHYLMARKLGFEPVPTFYEAVQKYNAVKSSSFWNGGLYIDCGRYYEGVRRYIDTFGRKNVLVLLTEDLNKRPKETLDQVTRFLGIDPMPDGGVNLKDKHNAYAMPRFPLLYRLLCNELFKPAVRQRYFPPVLRKWLRKSPMLFSNAKPQIDERSRLFLQSIYEPEVARLEQFLGRDLSALRKSWDQQPVA
jgi:hypothetical protein